MQLEKIDFSSHKNDWKMFRSNNRLIALNILYVPCNTKEVRHAYISKHNSVLEKEVILLMITDNEKWHYIAAKNCLLYFKK